MREDGGDDVKCGWLCKRRVRSDKQSEQRSSTVKEIPGLGFRAGSLRNGLLHPRKEGKDVPKHHQHVPSREGSRNETWK